MAAGLWLLAVLLACLACQPPRRAGNTSPFPTRFGVAIGDVDLTTAQLDALGPVWYMDYRWKGPALPGHERLYTVRCGQLQKERVAIAEAMQSSGSSWWSLGNEPNDPAQDGVTPAEYAALYATFEQCALGATQCRLVSAGIANADWNWARAFRESFRDAYGRYPRVDAWNIHNYILESALDPYDVAEFQRRVLAFRRWMESIGDGQRPLLLTEFGVLYGAGCCGRPLEAPERVQAFMRSVVGWLQDSDTVAAWAWFCTYSAIFNGNLMTADGRLTDLGEVYRDLGMQQQGF